MRIIPILLAALLFLPGASFAQFHGTLQLLPDGCEDQGECRLGKDFGFLDPNGIGWMAAKGNTTDGASIPGWAQPIVGGPFTVAYVKAAVLHDHYCDRHVRSWAKTHRMFYHALRASGVSIGRANILYGAVMLGGPKWMTKIVGRPCPIGQICAYDVIATEFLTRPDRYATEEFENELAQLMGLLEASDDASAEEVEALVYSLRPDDEFLANPDGVTVETYETIYERFKKGDADQ